MDESKKSRKMTESEWIREYLEKVGQPVESEEAGTNTESVVAGENNMGGKAVNFDAGGEEKGMAAPKAQSMNMTTKPDMKKVSGAGKV